VPTDYNEQTAGRMRGIAVSNPGRANDFQFDNQGVSNDRFIDLDAVGNGRSSTGYVSNSSDNYQRYNQQNGCSNLNAQIDCRYRHLHNSEDGVYYRSMSEARNAGLMAFYETRHESSERQLFDLSFKAKLDRNLGNKFC
jgi:hypothetical protein